MSQLPPPLPPSYQSEQSSPGLNHIMTIEEIKEEVLWVRAHFNQDILPKLGSLTIKTF